ncbi:hypothetical protein [Hoeflea sp.]|uniref:hypothetical protein n=1 Tax=Hoeflea sp. TaxID=1940281 RepID=UPI001990F74A|nr:hypothetical protein [Hoeflea sp.]MBC7282578.1 hypothetical protein [Hoeflea sp.]
MTTYTAITDTETGFEKPVTISLIRRLRDNPLAIQQGDATAPSIYTGIAAKHTVGGVGTYAILTVVASATAVVTGSSYAGSNLAYTTTDTTTGATTSQTPSGTWRALADGSLSGNISALFIRIA